MQVAGIPLTNPDRVLYPRQGITKKMLAEFYEGIADHMLPFLKNRPLTLVRCPSGHQKGCFYQKHAKDTLPAVLSRVEIRESRGTGTYLALDSPAGIIALVQIGVLEFHVWGSTVENLERPDTLIFDLDPDPSVHWRRVIDAARRLRSKLKSVGPDCVCENDRRKGASRRGPCARGSDMGQSQGVFKSSCGKLCAGVSARVCRRDV